MIGTKPPQVLIPYSRFEAIAPHVAGGIANVTTETIRRWCAMHFIGRVVGGRWYVSKPALLMYLDGDRAALKAYLAGERQGIVAPYFERAGVPIPQGAQEQRTQ
jgi:hypothetical protein